MVRILDIASYITLLIAFIVMLIYYRKLKNCKLEYLVYFFAYIILHNFIADILWSKFQLYNVWWFNIYYNFEILFFLFIFYQYLKSKKIKRFLVYTGAIYEVYFLINFLVLSEHYNIAQSFPQTFGILVLIITIFGFLLEMFQSDKILYIHHYLIFWLSIGLLVYYLVQLPVTISNYFTNREEFINDESLLVLGGIQYLASIILFSTIIIGVIWSKKPYLT